MTVTEITEFLNAHDIKPSYQRIKVYECLIKQGNHMTVESIYRELIATIPTLSKTTIYNTLKIFEDHHILNVINLNGNEMRYDLILDEHGHFQCKVCQEIFDFPLQEPRTQIEQINGFKIEERNVFLKGICKDCLEKR